MSLKSLTSKNLEKLTHKQQVMFAVFCAEQVFHLNSEKNKPTARKAIDTTKLWLEGRATAEECEKVAYAAYAAANAAYAYAVANCAAYAAGYAARAANAANAAYAAADAANAAYAAGYAAKEYKQKIIEEQRNYYDNLLNLDKYAEELVK